MNIITGGKTPVPQGSNAQIVTKGDGSANFNDMKDMIEVKTSNNYQIGKQTINSRMGEDFEPNKPMVNYPNGEGAKASQNAYGTENILDKINTPVQNQNVRRSSQNSAARGTGQSAKEGPGQITDERLEEIKI